MSDPLEQWRDDLALISADYIDAGAIKAPPPPGNSAGHAGKAASRPPVALSALERRTRIWQTLKRIAHELGERPISVPGAFLALEASRPTPAHAAEVRALALEIETADEQRRTATLAHLGKCPICLDEHGDPIGDIWADADRATCDTCGTSAPKVAALEAFDEQRPRPIHEAAAWLTKRGDTVTHVRVRRLADRGLIPTYGLDEQRRRLVKPTDIRLHLLREKLA